MLGIELYIKKLQFVPRRCMHDMHNNRGIKYEGHCECKQMTKSCLIAIIA